VQNLLGHASAITTLQTYAHLWPGDDDRARAIMEGALGGLRTICGPQGNPERKVAGQKG
jgi:hypothetical protein